jgi:hypothetical protein
VQEEAQMMWDSLGGDSLKIRFGARNILSTDKSVQFATTAPMWRGVNRIRAQRNLFNSYDLLFYRVEGFRITVIARHMNIFPERFSSTLDSFNQHRLQTLENRI